MNDVSLLADEELAAAAAEAGAALVLSHARAPQSAMAGYGAWAEGAYTDVVADVLSEWERAAERASRQGVSRDALVLDPGLGFSKASRHSLTLLRELGRLVAGSPSPVLVGASRKSFLTTVDPEAPPTERAGASLAAAVFAVSAGAQIVRVHDVRATRQALDLWHLLSAPSRGDDLQRGGGR